jgi:Tfp pilus assembly protein PilP
MKRNLAILLLMSSAALAQTNTVAVKPVAKPSAATVKAVPQTPVQPNSAKVAPVPASKPATVSVQPAPAKPAVAVPAKAGVVASSPAKPAIVKANPPVVAVKPAPVPAKPAAIAKATPVNKSGDAKVPAKEMPKAVAAVKAPVKEMPKAAVAVKVPVKQASKPVAEAKKPTPSQTTVAVQDTKSAAADKKPASKTISAVGRRDPFVSPVVKLGTGGSGCSSGKRCLAIDQIALKGVVKADVGMIAVVVNAMNKAYFLRENDPVFNGYVIKITGDSIVFKETFHDRLGKELTRDVTKTITRPAV